MVTVKDAQEATLSIVKALHPISVILFGSVARDGQGADLDLLIITDDKTKISDSFHLQLHKCLKKYYRRFAIDPFVVSASLFNEYFSKGSPFIKMISKEGRLLYMKEGIGEPTESDGQKAIAIAKRVFKNINAALKK